MTRCSFLSLRLLSSSTEKCIRSKPIFAICLRRTPPAFPSTTHYPALRALLNEIGGTLKPKVRCVINPKSKGAEFPTAGSIPLINCQRAATRNRRSGTLPARGAIEAKSTTDDAFAVAKSEQVEKYLKLYRQVLVTNLRDLS